MLWTLTACSVIFFISASSFAAEASKGQSIPMSRHLKEGKKPPTIVYSHVHKNFTERTSVPIKDAE